MLTTISSIQTSHSELVERNASAFVGYGIERVKEHAVAAIVTAMCFDVCDDPVVAEMQAVAKVSMVFMEIERHLSPTEDYIDRPIERLRPFLISGAEERQQPWIDILNLVQLRNWHRKGVGDYGAAIVDLERTIETFLGKETYTEDVAGIRGWDWPMHG